MLCAGELPRERMPGPGDRVLCAVSGGRDSMVLLHLLWQWCMASGGGVTAAHFNHGLRPTAARDEAFVRDWCRSREIPFVSGAGDTLAEAARLGLSTEEAARKLRYAFLCETAERWKICQIYTAHHLSDNAETMLWNLIRGSGIRGLSGIRPVREAFCRGMGREPGAVSHGDMDMEPGIASHGDTDMESGTASCGNADTEPGTVSHENADTKPDTGGPVRIFRPLLDVSRQELEEYAAAFQIPHVEDETNGIPEAASRNFLRLRVMPLLRELNPRAEDHMAAAARELVEWDGWLHSEAERIAGTAEAAPGRVSIPRRAVADAPPPLRVRVLFALLDRLGVGRKDWGRVHMEALVGMCLTGDGRTRRLNLPGGVTAFAGRENLALEWGSVPPEETELREGEPLHWGPYLLTIASCPGGIPDGGAGNGGMDSGRRSETAGKPEIQGKAAGNPGKQGDTAGRPWEERLFLVGEGRVTVFPCRPASRLTLPGAAGSRTVKRLCLDRGISLKERETLPALHIDGKLAAVWRIGVDAAFAAGDGPVRQICGERISETAEP